MTKRFIKALMALVFALFLAIGLFVAPAQANNPVHTGDADDGTYHDSDYLPASHYGYAEWVRKSQSGNGAGTLGMIVSPNTLADYQGHKTCLQVAEDWVTPAQARGGHYDYREVRNCDSNSQYLWSFIEPTNTCDNGLVLYTCDVPLKRVMISRYSPYYNTIINSECYDFGTNWCTGWVPKCAGTDLTPVTCTVWVRHEDGSLDKYGNTDAEHTTSPSV